MRQPTDPGTPTSCERRHAAAAQRPDPGPSVRAQPTPRTYWTEPARARLAPRDVSRLLVVDLITAALTIGSGPGAIPPGRTGNRQP